MENSENQNLKESNNMDEKKEFVKSDNSTSFVNSDNSFRRESNNDQMEDNSVSLENSFDIIEQTNSRTLDYFNRIYINNLELVQSLKTELFELEIQIETLEKTRELYSYQIDNRRSIFSPLDGENDHTITKGKQIALQINDLENAKELLENRIQELEQDTRFYKEQVSMLSKAQKCIHAIFTNIHSDNTDEDEDILIDFEDAFEFIEEDSESKTTHNYNMLMLHDYIELQAATRLDRRVKQELISTSNKLGVLRWLLHSDLSRARVTLDELLASQKSILNSVDRILDQLNYNIDTKLPIEDQLNNLIQNYQQRNKECMIKFSCDHSKQDLNLPHFINIRLIQMIQEIFDNIFKHSGADEVIAKVFISNRLVDVDIHDNGIGIPEDYLDRSNWYSGLHKVQEIIYQLDGNLQIQGDLISGTDIRFSFPIKA